jgi:CheY-like chemotaxis protein
VFDRFRQQDPSTTRSSGGLGLGLSIVRSLVELHGGTVAAVSGGEGQGATFVVRLPRAFVPAAAAVGPFAPSLRVPARSHVPEEINGLSLVIVDDDADTLDLMTSLLEQAGAQVKPARTAAEAFEAVQSVRPDLLISDIGMPGEDGYSLMHRIRLLPVEAGGKTPAVSLTAFARAEDRARALQGGFQAHVAKPVEMNELLAVIASLVARP